MRRDAFSALNPIVVLVYFVAVMVLSMLLVSPVCLTLSCVCSFMYGIYLNGAKQAAFNLKLMLPTLVLAAAVNVLFNHRGMTILCYFPDGNALTLESVYYGLAAGAMIVSAINWFSCLNAALTADKTTYLFGRILPSMALVFSMLMRFVPRFCEQFKKAEAAQNALYGKCEKLKDRLKRAIKLSSAVLTWAFENSVETAQSMKARAYGSGKRSAYALYKWRKEDSLVLLGIVVLAAVAAIGYINGALYFAYSPRLYGESGTKTVLYTLVYAVFALIPMLINTAEEIKWRRLLN